MITSTLLYIVTLVSVLWFSATFTILFTLFWHKDSCNDKAPIVCVECTCHTVPKPNCTDCKKKVDDKDKLIQAGNAEIRRLGDYLGEAYETNNKLIRENQQLRGKTNARR